MNIVFKNGKQCKISKEIAQVLYDKIIKGCNDFQCFHNEKNEVLLIVNLSDVSYII